MGLENDAVEEEETAVESKKPKGNSNHLVLRGKTKLSREEVKLGSCTLELLVPNIPKHITTSDEKYVLRCLEAIHSYASRTRILPVDCVSTDEQQQHQGVARFASVFGDWSVVSISSSQSMQNILKSPLLKQFGSADSNPGPRPPTLRTSYLPSSRAEAAVASSHERGGSVSSAASSTFSGKSSSGGSSSEGTMQCCWKDGLPHHVFSVEDKREMYRAKAAKAADEDQCCYVYTFYAGKQGRRDRNSPEMETVATMRISTSITVCSSSGKEIAETKFILYAPDEEAAVHSEETGGYKKSENLPRKVASLFRPGSSSSSSTQQRRARTPIWNIHEIAAVVLKEVRENPVWKRDAGGWGLKFLKKSPKRVESRGNPPRDDAGECSTSMTVLIPAGIHGGTKRPSPLVERWTSGGACDCGGWDIGCPLTVLVPAEIPKDGPADRRPPPPVNLFLQGSRESPVLSMANVGGGLCNVRFEGTLSSLQCFGIAVAVFHSQNHHRLL